MKVYVATDGDSIGTQVGRAGLANDEEGMRRISDGIHVANGLITAFVLEHDGTMITSGGDESNFSISGEKLSLLPNLREQWAEAAGATLSIGVGQQISQAGMALMGAKLRGKDQIVFYTPDLEKEVQEVMGKEQSPEEKLKESYFKAEGQKMAAYKPIKKAQGQSELKLLDQLLGDEQDTLAPTPSSPDLKGRMDAAAGQAPPAPANNQMQPPPPTAMPPQGTEPPPPAPGQEGQAQMPGQEAEGDPGQSETKEMLKQIMGEALEAIKSQSKNVEALKESDPKTYEAITALVEATTQMAEVILGGEEEGEAAPEGEAPPEAEGEAPPQEGGGEMPPQPQ